MSKNIILAGVTYNGVETITAPLASDPTQKATFTADGIIPTGNINITNTNSTNVTNYATAQVVDNNLVAGNIKKDVSILGITGSYEGGGGQQPTLFAPVVTEKINQVLWSNNSQNGGFDVTITANVNGTPVTSPLTITEQMDGQTLTITASATNFQAISSTILLKYIEVGNSTISLNASTATGNMTEIVRIGFFDNDNYFPFKQYFNGSTVSNSFVYITANGIAENKTQTAQFSLVGKSNYSGLMCVAYNNASYTGQLFGYQTNSIGLTTGTWDNNLSLTVSVYDVANATTIYTWESTFTAGSGNPFATYYSDLNSVHIVENNVYTVIINATLTPKS